VAFSLKSLLKGGKKGAKPVMEEDDDPFMSSGADEIPESEVLKIERADAARKAKTARKKKGPLSGLTSIFGRKGKKGKQKSTPEVDPFDNPELMALIASEVAAVPMPDTIAEADPEPEEAPKKADAVRSPADAQPANVEDDMDDDQQPVEEALPAFMSKTEREYEGMADFAMPTGGSKGMGYDGDDDEFGGGFPVGGMDDDGGGSGRGKKMALIAAGIAALALAGAGAWWMMGTSGSDGGEQTVAEGEGPGKDDQTGGMNVPHALPGDRVSMAMPPPPATPVLAEGVAGDERSSARRPWLNDGSTPLGPQPGAAGEQTAEAPAAVATTAEGEKAPAADGTVAGGAEGKEAAAPPAAPVTASQDAQAPHGPSDGLGDAAGHMPVASVDANEKKPTEGGAPTSGMTQLAQAPLSPLTDPDLPTPPDGKTAIPSYDKLPKPKQAAAALETAPINDLARQTAMGLLPVRAPDGRTSAQSYARPFTGDVKKPRVALVVVGLGLDTGATAAAISALPADVTLAFSPYAPNLAAQMAAARAAGHEVMLDLPMEPTDFPSRDPGPLAMLTVQGPAENVSRLEALLGKGVGFTGVINSMGSKFTASPDAMRPVLEALGQRGLLYVNSVPGAAGLAGNVDVALPMAEALLSIDQSPFREAIDGRLTYLLDAAKKRGRVIAIVHPTPLSFARVISWSQGLADKGVLLAPVSAAVGGSQS
jgi:polysaccharide deacetylase 2 family uncharacterized protein YibQ